MSKIRVVAQVDMRPPEYATAPTYAPKPQLVNDPRPFGSLSDKDLEQMLLEEVPQEPVGTTLAIAWESGPQDHPYDGWVLADTQTNQLYELYLSGDNSHIIVNPVEPFYRPVLTEQKTFAVKPDGSPDWGTIYKTYFPGGFHEVNVANKVVEPTKETTASYKYNIPDDFWRKTLAKLLEGYSHREVYKNPYKKNKY